MAANLKQLSNKEGLSFLALFSLVIGSIMGSGVFDIPENVAHNAGPGAVIICWIITTVGMLSLAWSMIYITGKRPDIKDGIYGYAKHGFGDYVGFNSAWGYWISANAGTIGYFVYIFAALGQFSIFHYFGKGNTIQAIIAESSVLWGLFFLIRGGIQQASVINIVISLIKTICLITVLGVFVYGFDSRIFARNMAMDLSLPKIEFFGEIKKTMLITVWDFIGIEAACLFAIRARKMEDVSKATFMGVVSVLIIVSAISILPFGILNDKVIASLSTPSVTGVLATVFGDTIGIAVRIAVIISVAGALLAWVLNATSIAFLAASDGAMPKFLKNLNPQNVPGKSLLLSCLFLQAFILVTYFTDTVYLGLIKLSTSMILIPYLLTSMYAFKLVITDKIIRKWDLFKGMLALIYGFWLIYAGGVMYLCISTILYAGGAIFYKIARNEQGKPMFDNNSERILFVLLFIAAIASCVAWCYGVIEA